MKIRNHRKHSYYFYPAKDSELKNRQFKTKKSLLRYLNSNVDEAVNGTVGYNEKSFSSNHFVRQWFVWYNDKPSQRNQQLRVSLRQLDFRGRKYITRRKIVKTSKSTKKYYAFSEKVINLMGAIEDRLCNGESISKYTANRLVTLFYKRGFIDFVPDEETQRYIDGNIEKGIPFFYWSDRCNGDRMKTIIEYFKRENLI